MTFFASVYLTRAQPLELAIGNIVRRVLYIVREEVDTCRKEAEQESKVGEAGDMNRVSIKKVVRNTIEGVNELMTELESIYEPIAEQALEHIHANEVILTFGTSRTVAHFLKVLVIELDLRLY